jgi:hypothetical protein
MLKKILIVTLVMALGASVLFAESFTGRNIVKEGSFTTINGTLRYDGVEWYLTTDDGTYQLHFGNKSYLSSTGIELEAGKNCEVDGIASGKEVVVVSATMNGKSYSFRDENGVPLWAGNGNQRDRGGYGDRNSSRNEYGNRNGQPNGKGRS